MKKVLIEAGPIIDQNKSGVGHYVEGLMSGLVNAQNNNLTIVGYYFNFMKFNKEKLPNNKNINLHRIWLMPGKLISLCRRFGFQPYLEFFVKTNVDYIIFTNYVSLPLLNKKVKKILVIYDLGFRDYPNYIQDVNLAYLNRFCPPSIKSADLIITISEFTKSRINHYFPGLKAPIIVTAIPPSGKPAKPSPGSLDVAHIKTGRYIFYIGTIEPRKNIQNLIKAYSLLDKALRDNYSLVIAGGQGWKNEEIWKDINKYKGLGFNIITTGYVDNYEKAYLYKNAACFVLASHYEGFGMPILEAVQHKIPVAVSDLPVFREIIDDAALYFNKDSALDIAQKIKILLTNGRTRQILIKKGQMQLRKYSWEDNVKKIINEIERIST